MAGDRTFLDCRRSYLLKLRASYFLNYGRSYLLKLRASYFLNYGRSP
ncbi:MAG: hypothetical protein MUE44_18350 [Oscillatoriaceae cyanobacterium Prado104]|nr:hypothetical protein [Oscillatoriaceae cyanobacterium Prado104]